MIHFEKSAPVKIKGAGRGFWLTLDPSHSCDVLISEVDRIFRDLKHLAMDASVVLDVGDAKGQEPLLEQIKTYLITTFGVGSVTPPQKKRPAPVKRIRQRDLSKGWDHHRSDVLMLRGRVRAGQKIDTQKHLIITGDVNPGAELYARGDIIVLGKLMGKVHAGKDGDASAMVFALVFKPTHIKIGGLSAAGSKTGEADLPAFASVEGDQIIVKDYMKANPFGRIPWPEVV